MVSDSHRDKGQQSSITNKKQVSLKRSVHKSSAEAVPIIISNEVDQPSASMVMSGTSSSRVLQSFANTLPGSSSNSLQPLSANTLSQGSSSTGVRQSSASIVPDSNDIVNQSSTYAVIAVQSQRESFINRIMHPPTTSISQLWQCDANHSVAGRNRRVSIEEDKSFDHQSSEDDDLPVPPDGGYGWVIVFASFCASLIADGSGFSFGVLFAELVEVFGESRGDTAWVGSLFVSMPSICGPIASVITDRLGCRKTMMAGGVIATVGCFASAFVGSISLLCLTFGLIAGFGLSLVFIPSFLIVALYFKERRSFATGLSVAGSGIGTFIFAPLTELLIESYCWRGAMIILAGFMFNTVVCGALLRPLVPRYRHSTFDTENLNSRTAVCLSGEVRIVHRFVLRCRPGVDESSCSAVAVTDSRDLQTKIGCQDLIYFEPVTRSVIQFPTYLKCEWETQAPSLLEELDRRSANNKDTSLIELFAERNMLDRYHVTVESPTPSQVREKALTVSSSSGSSGSSSGGSSGSSSSNTSSNDSSPRRASRRRHRRTRTLITIQQPDESEDRRKQRRKQRHKPVNGRLKTRRSTCGRCVCWCKRRCRTLLRCCRRGNQREQTARKVDDDGLKTIPIGRELIVGTYGGRSVEKFRMISRRDVFYRGGLLKAKYMVNARSLPSASCPALYSSRRSAEAGGLRCWQRLQAKFSWSNVSQRLLDIFDFSVFNSVVFNFFCMHSVLLFLAYDIPYVYIPDEASTNGINSGSAAFLVSIIGLGNTVGQIIMGYIGDLPTVNTLLLYVITTTIAGIITLFVPFLKHYWSFSVYCALYGIMISANYALTTIILVDLIGMKKLSNAFGFVSLFEGLANLIGPPLAGMVFDNSGSYIITFILSGLLVAVAGVMLLAMPLISRREKRRRQLRRRDRRIYPGAVTSSKTRQTRPRTRSSIESYNALTSSVLRLSKPRPSIDNDSIVTSSHSEPRITNVTMPSV